MANIRAHVRGDGTIDGYEIETYYQPCVGLYIDWENKFVGVISDIPGAEAETRILFETLENAGFVFPSPPEKP